MTKKYRSKKSTTKKYKKKRGGRNSEFGEITREPVVEDQDIEYVREDLAKEKKCDEAIADFTEIYNQASEHRYLSTEDQHKYSTRLNNMRSFCEPRCENNKQNCKISLYNKDDPNFFKKLHSESKDGAVYDTAENVYLGYHDKRSTNELYVSKAKTDENQLPQMKLTDKMFILPCLQEREQLNEMEQRGSIIQNYEQTAIPQGNAIYYQFWHGKENFDSLDDERTSIDVPSLLEDMTPSKTTVLGMFGKLPTCRKYTTDQKWEMYGKWAEANFKKEEEEEEEEEKKNEEPKKPKGRTVLLITHHNRLRGLSTGDSEGALLPIKDKKQCDSYANNFCFRIHYDPTKDEGNKITTKIAFQGFPDKGGFDKNKCRIEEGCKKKTGGGENYTYCCPTKDVTNIDTTLLEQGLKNANIKPNTTFYVIRHGNAIHNKPMNIKDGTQLDSPLTPLGLYQAKTLGCFLRQNYKDDFNGQVILGTSLLSRTQLTGLAILNEITGGFDINKNKKLLTDYDLLKEVSLIKFTSIVHSFAPTKSKVSNLAIFNQLQPVSVNVEDFYQYCCSKLKLGEYIPPKFKTVKICPTMGGKKKKQTRKIRRKKN
jgi:hypothetical protein